MAPKYFEAYFVIYPFSQLRRTADPVFSPPLIHNGFCWQLKVFPNGVSIVEGGYISVFLQLCSGCPEKCRYECIFELIHQSSKDSSNNIVKKFECDFKVGECWGIQKFLRLELLNDEGYFDKTADTLVLRYVI